MGKDIGRSIIMFLMLLVVPGIVIYSSPASAYTDEEINQAISDLNAKISSVKDATGNSASVSGKLFFDYQNDMKDGSKKNLFEITRMYIDIKKDLSRNVSVRFTPDVERFATTEADQRYYLFLKYAYFDLNNLGVPFIGLDTVRIGQQPTHWIDFADNLWNMRYIAKSITDFYGIFSSADIGVSALGNVDLGGMTGLNLGRYYYQAMYTNGEGYKKDESSTNNYGKSLSLRINAEPVVWGSSDKITAGIGYLVKNYPVEPGGTVTYYNLEDVVSGLVAWNFSTPGNGVVVFEGFQKHGSGSSATVIGNGLSLGGQYEVIPDVVLLARIDNYDPDQATKNDEQNFTVYGVQYNWGSNVKIALDQQLSLKNVNVKDVYTWNLHTEVKW